MTWITVAAYASLAIAAGSATVTYVQQEKAADAQEEAGKMQQKAADQNARNIELQNAENVRRQRVNNRRSLARMRTTMAGTSGLVFDGTMEDSFLETAGQMELQVQDAARGASMDASNSRSAGNLANWEARTMALSTRNKALGTLISTAGDSASAYANKPRPTA